MKYSERKRRRCAQQRGLLCSCCRVRESNWCMLLGSAKIKNIHQWNARILEQLQGKLSLLSAAINHAIASSLSFSASAREFD